MTFYYQKLLNLKILNLLFCSFELAPSLPILLISPPMFPCNSPLKTSTSYFLGGSTGSIGEIFFFYLDFLSRITGLQGKGKGSSLTPHYHLHPLYRHLDTNWAITAVSSPLHIASSRTRTGNLSFPSASRLPLSYAP